VINIRGAFTALACCITAATPSIAIAQPSAQTPQPTAAPTPGQQTSDTLRESSTGAVTAADKAEQLRKQKRYARKLKRKVRRLRQATWHWQDASTTPRSSTKYQERYWNKTWRLKMLVKLWQKRLKQAKHRALNPPNESAWRCIHSKEAPPWYGGWKTNTGNGYYGGLQMNLTFIRQYGWRLYKRLGTANNWPWYAQMWVAERARSSGRGFYPWPQTARMCRLI